MIKDLKELQALFKMCRKQGVTEIKLGDIAISFGDVPRKGSDDDDQPDDIPSPELTPEQLMFFSVGGAPPP